MQFSPPNIVVTKHSRRMEVGMFIRLVLRPGTGLCDLILILIREVITSTLHKTLHITCELSFGKSEPRICIRLTMLHAQSAVCWSVLRLVYCNKR